MHLVNDTGTGNTLACDHPMVEELVLDALRHFVLNAGVDGFRFDLAPVLGRTADGFDRKAHLLLAIHNDPVLKDRVMIAEPWDIGPGGYQLGNFPNEFLEWNDKYRDDIRRFWRGDHGMVGALATRLAGSSDVFRHRNALRSRSVNFIAAHDGVDPRRPRHATSASTTRRMASTTATATTRTCPGTTASKARPMTRRLPASAATTRGRCWPRCLPRAAPSC